MSGHSAFAQPKTQPARFYDAKDPGPTTAKRADAGPCLMPSDNTSYSPPIRPPARFYGAKDDLERFMFFSRAALEWLTISGKQPDVIHLHDWQSAAVVSRDADGPWRAEGGRFDE